ncbi:GIY-YIG nuclease family protein [Clostridium sp.]|uniref:GIY-YIG nuclease family protein n=1 Tax=Clostridium sp. TaxID=1506 RepID=UPI003216342B
MLDKLEELLIQSGIISLFTFKNTVDNSGDSSDPYVRYNVKPNQYRIRAFILKGNGEDNIFTVYHSKVVDSKLKESLKEIGNVVRSTRYVIDYKVEDNLQLVKVIKNILEDGEVIKSCLENRVTSRTPKFEGLDLPDVDTSVCDVMGQTYTWRDIIAISEDNSDENKLKEVLSQKGIYIQRAVDGTSRYIGSAYGEGGILARWMKHLVSNGDARHLNLFILEHGYNSVVFSVIEFYEGEDIIQRENKWKETLGTINYGPYNKVQLNNN